MSVSLIVFKKSLKIPKGQSACVYRKKDRHHNGQKKKYKRTNNDLQHITHKTKDRVTQTPLISILVNNYV